MLVTSVIAGGLLAPLADVLHELMDLMAFGGIVAAPGGGLGMTRYCGPAGAGVCRASSGLWALLQQPGRQIVACRRCDSSPHRCCCEQWHPDHPFGRPHLEELSAMHCPQWP